MRSFLENIGMFAKSPVATKAVTAAMMHGVKSVVLSTLHSLGTAVDLGGNAQACRRSTYGWRVLGSKKGRGRYEGISPSAIASRASCRRLHVLSLSCETSRQNRPRIFRL